MIRSKIINIFKNTGALLNGHFVLTSGRHSSSYFQCAKVLQHPKYLTLFAEMIAKHFIKEKMCFWDFVGIFQKKCAGFFRMIYPSVITTKISILILRKLSIPSLGH